MPRVLFTFPSRYLSTIGLPGVLSLARWSWQIQAGFLVPRPTQGPAKPAQPCVYGAFTPYGCAFQAHSTSAWPATSRPYNPSFAETMLVWALPLPLAATRGVAIAFLSSGYLDVSVRRVSLPHCCRIPACAGGLPHSGTRGSMAICASPQIFAAYRALLRLWGPRHPPCALNYFLTPFPRILHLLIQRFSFTNLILLLPTCQRTSNGSPPHRAAAALWRHRWTRTSAA